MTRPILPADNLRIQRDLKRRVDKLDRAAVADSNQQFDARVVPTEALNLRALARPEATHPTWLMPTSIENPVIIPIAERHFVGETIKVDFGRWEGEAPITYSVEWFSVDADNITNVIALQTFAPYQLLLTEDTGDSIVYAVVTGSNEHGGNIAQSNFVHVYEQVA